MRAIVFDYETTGLLLHPSAPLWKQPRAIEFGYMVLNERGDEVEAGDFLIYPGCELPPQIPAITGITDEMLRDQPPFSVWSARIKDLFESCTTMVGHNLPFDRRITELELARLESGMEISWPDNAICTVGLYNPVFGYDPKLTELYEHICGTPLAQKHRALSDVENVVDIIRHDKLWEYFT